MATPVGHYLVGLSIAQVFARDDAERRQGFGLATVALLADLDVLPGILAGDLGRFHHDVSHSLTVAAMFSIAGLLALTWRGSRRSVYLATLLFILYASHVVLDFFTLDTGAPYGVPLFWPWIPDTYESPWLILPNVQHTGAPLIGTHNLLLIMREVLLFLPLAGLVYTLRASRLPWPKTAAWLYGGWFLAAVGGSVLSLARL